MPTLNLRTVGMSYVLEGIAPSGLPGRAILDELTARYGPAVAILSTATAEGTDPGDEPAIDALIVDRKAATWDAFRDRLRAWVEGRGCRYVSWAENPLAAQPSATLHFHP